MKQENITAWALDELSEEEKAQIEALLKDDAETQALASHTKDFCQFLTAELGTDSLTLNADQRERLEKADLQLLESSAEPPPTQAKPQPSWWRRHALVNLSAAAAVVLGTTVLIRQQMEQEQITEGQVMSYVQPGGEELRKQDATAVDDEMLLSRAAPVPMEAPKPASPQTESDQRRDITLGFAKNEAFSDSYTGSTEGSKDSPALRPQSQNMTDLAAAAAPAKPASPPPPPPVAAALGDSSMMATLSGSGTVSGRMSMSAGAASTEMMQRVGAGQLGNDDLETNGRLSPPVVGLLFGNRRDTETYTAITENRLTDVLREPLSTFSIDVDTASYANVRRFLNQNTRPPRDAVRVEELINYFPTDEDGPAANAKEPFAVKVEMAASPWQPAHRLARIAIKGKQIGKDRQPSNLVFLVDVSGSMGEPNKLPLVQQSLRMLAEQLGENDRVSMVTYAGGTQVVLASTSGQQKAEIMAAIDRLNSGGSTHGSAGIRLAYEQAVAGFIKGGVNRVILCSDGDFNVGISDPTELETFITEKARSGVFLSVLGYGQGNLHDRTMETLADKGNGNYAYIDSLSEARKVLVEQMNGTLVTIAKDVKIQVEFNPAIIRSYRLIGYENRLLAKEDFNDDTKDAGEIGAGHSVTALYELVPANLPPGTEPRPAVDALKYQPTAPAAEPAAPAGDAAGEALTVKLRYKEPEGSTSQLIEVPVKDDDRALDQAGQEFQFTAAVAGFGLLLRESSYAGTLTWEQVRQRALAGKGSDPLGYRGEFIQLIEKARGLSR
ncbi:von Willebrand factor type A domain-containing protein [Prosthecobacter debontii]|uniref:von Willebrand factor type A domain-containing protein n=1 Tax=Prosthecobacter debontii TaxID=48467 RepID=A0A1T4YPT3_9BACT|nr:von Willebrand factor type A domain-containing protein [Prosthecobacter debontii]SKB03844.1 von Willebrand factor type A domain-containing protein [Prosthecobacter debontii]